MKRTLLRPPAFGRDLRKWLKSRPDTAEAIEATLEQLSTDAAAPFALQNTTAIDVLILMRTIRAQLNSREHS